MHGGIHSGEHSGKHSGVHDGIHGDQNKNARRRCDPDGGALRIREGRP